MSSRKYFLYRKPMEDPSETDMLDWRPIGDRNIKFPKSPSFFSFMRLPNVASSETNMPDRRPIEDRQSCGVQSEFKHIF